MEPDIARFFDNRRQCYFSTSQYICCNGLSNSSHYARVLRAEPHWHLYWSNLIRSIIDFGSIKFRYAETSNTRRLKLHITAIPKPFLPYRSFHFDSKALKNTFVHLTGYLDLLRDLNLLWFIFATLRSLFSSICPVVAKDTSYLNTISSNILAINHWR